MSVPNHFCTPWKVSLFDYDIPGVFPEEDDCPLREARVGTELCMYAGRLLASGRSTTRRQQRGGPPPQAPRRLLPAKSNRLRTAEKKGPIREEQAAGGALQRLLCHQRVITIVNTIVLIALSWHTMTLILAIFAARERKFSTTVRSYLAAFATPQPQSVPGFAGVRQASFRDKYPSTTLSRSGTFDAVYVISNPRCSQWKEFSHRAKMANLSITKWPMHDWQSISLETPPVGLSQRVRESLDPRKRTAVKTLKRQLVYLDAHRRVWQAVANKSTQRVLVVDETVFPSKRLLTSLPPMMTNIDTESIARQKAWHVVQFRLVRAWAHKRDEWCMNPSYHHAVIRANAYVGAGMYALSLHGARYLLQHTKEYRAPIDVEFGLLQVEDPEFVALSGCNNDRVRPFCPEMVDVVQGRESMECSWRRFWETRNVDVLKKLLRA